MKTAHTGRTGAMSRVLEGHGMRGTHYGADYRWFTRFIGDDIKIPKVDVKRTEVDAILAERGLQPQLDAEKIGVDVGPLSDDRDLHRVTGGVPPGAGPKVSASGEHRPGSLKAALARARARGGRLMASLSPTDTGEDGSRPIASGPTPTLTPEIQQLAAVIQESVNPRELAKYSFEDLLAAFRAARLNPGTGAKVVQAWAHGRRLAPEQVVEAMKRVKDEWLTYANEAPAPSAALLLPREQWDYDMAVGDYLNQRDNVGRGPKDIDRERLMLLRRLMASFSGQANYGFTGADAVAEAASGAEILTK